MAYRSTICDAPTPSEPYTIGVLEGEGIGREVMAAASQVLEALPNRFSVQRGGAIGLAAEREGGRPLSDQVAAFCEEVFSQGGAVLAGPGGGRFVYDMRRRFDLFCKISPIHAVSELAGACRMRAECIGATDIVVVRDNAGGIYQGEWGWETTATRGRRAKHEFHYDEADVERIIRVGATLARQRRGEMIVVYKEFGVPTVSQLWRACAQQIAASTGVRCKMLDVDFAAYWMLERAETVDVVVTPNLFGDILSDLGGLLMGSRGLIFSGNFSQRGAAVYQTNHGAAHDLAGSDTANPGGQIGALAMLLRESFGLAVEADCIEQGLRQVWREGWRTADVAEPGCRVIGTQEIGQRVAAAVASLIGLHVR